ncbi:MULTISPECIES: FtsX-like permease family protein [Mesoflavibacter]|uniref:ABC transporter permease n=1 Tax=Mesoflavibacter profundi TaxID=2708110 RepID=A0ABT4S1N7_9FLAO|nr:MULTISPECIES: FtsX-like permease family protein [Mesoflavibacter]MDA0177975.1 ABC transporter permease [Mesoflavibacter profundi]QIJ88937.1 Lipoprotein releasing system transmembrane protein LolC/LolE [Mesoflavibacter sp. HG96]QIJ91665.1 Lipoprotein releasing system transmembrane protein LolC/LolE [Mesoflavibacter sp. HG37]
MNFSLYIVKRYLLSKSSNNAINFISIIAMIGIVLGSASLFIVLSGFAGLRNFTLEFTTIIDPDLKVETTVGKSFILSKQQEEKLKSIKAIKSFSKIIEERVIATYDGNNHPAYIKGVDQNFNSITKIDSVIPIGNWIYPETPQSVVGWTISTHLSVGANDYGEAMTLSVPKPGKGQITSQNQAINQVKVVNVGIYDINEDINNKYIFTPIYIAKELLNYSDNQITSIEFDVDENANLEETKAQIQNILGKNIIVKDKDQLNDAIYKMLNTENLAVYLIFTLVLIIALFNIIGTIIMAILDKKQTLNTLYNLGASVKDIRNIFLYQGILMTLIGGILGLIIGYILVQIQLSFKLVMITPTLPYPVALQLKNFVIVLITLMILGIIASKIASSRINRELVKTQ